MQHFNFFLTKICIALCFLSSSVCAKNYYVSIGGSDNNSGTSASNAWKTLAHACKMVPEGPHTIILGPGAFTESETSYPKSGVRILGSAEAGSNKTTIRVANSWQYSGNTCAFPDTNVNKIPDGYIIKILNKKNITISRIEFEGASLGEAHGAIFANRSDYIDIDRIAVRNFSFAGAILNLCKYSKVQHSNFYNSATNKVCDASKLGSLSTRYLEHSEIYDNYFHSDSYNGYGYRGRGHENVKIHGNTFKMHGHDFDIEIAHFHEFGTEIYNNVFRGPVSLPRQVNQQNPASRGYTYSVRVHDNISYAAYAIEGSRSYLEIDHNIFLSTTVTGGRIYSDFGGTCDGPIYIHHNIAESVDRGFIFKQDSHLKNLFVYNNTVYMDTSYDNRFIDTYRTPSSSDWVVKNNIIVAPNSKPGKFKIGTDIIRFDATNNVYQNLSNVPSGNFNQNPGLRLEGDDPKDYYYPKGPYSFVVDKGDIFEEDYKWTAPDVGALEFDPNVYNSSQQLLALQNKGSEDYIWFKNSQLSMRELNDEQVLNWESHKFILVCLNDGFYALKHQKTGKYLWYKQGKISMININDDKLNSYGSHKLYAEQQSDGYFWMKHKVTNTYLYDKGQSGLEFLGTPEDNWNNPKWEIKETNNNKLSKLTNVVGIDNNSLIPTKKTIVFPNPVNDELTINIANYHQGTIEIFSLDGQIMISTQIPYKSESFKLNVADLKKGVYILKIKTEEKEENLMLLKK